MGGNLIFGLLRMNLPHLIALFVYGAIAIVLSVICYVVFTKLIPFKISFDSDSREVLTAVVLAVGIVVSMSLVVALNATKPPLPAPFPRSLSIALRDGKGVLSGSGCSGGCSSSKLDLLKKLKQKQLQAEKGKNKSEPGKKAE